mgnify:FL=1
MRVESASLNMKAIRPQLVDSELNIDEKMIPEQRSRINNESSKYLRKNNFETIDWG